MSIVNASIIFATPVLYENITNCNDRGLNFLPQTPLFYPALRWKSRPLSSFPYKRHKTIVMAEDWISFHRNRYFIRSCGWNSGRCHRHQLLFVNTNINKMFRLNIALVRVRTTYQTKPCAENRFCSFVKENGHLAWQKCTRIKLIEIYSWKYRETQQSSVEKVTKNANDSVKYLVHNS